MDEIVEFRPKDYTITACEHLIHVVDKKFNEDYWSANLKAIDKNGSEIILSPSDISNVNRYDMTWPKLRLILESAGFIGVKKHKIKCDFYNRREHETRTYYVWKNPIYQKPMNGPTVIISGKELN